MGRSFFSQMHLQSEVTGINLVHGSPSVAIFLQVVTVLNGSNFGWGCQFPEGF